MTVGELKLYLEPLPDDMPVYRDDDLWGPEEIKGVHITHDMFFDDSGEKLVGVLLT